MPLVELMLLLKEFRWVLLIILNDFIKCGLIKCIWNIRIKGVIYEKNNLFWT